MLAVICISSLFAVPAFAANKAVRGNLKTIAFDPENDDPNHIFFGATQKSKGKATKTMKLSCEVYLPVSALKSDGDHFIIDPMVGLWDDKGYYGTIYGKYRVCLQLQNKKPVLLKETDKGIGAKLSSKVATVKKSGKYYVITIKKIPLCNWAFDMTPDKKIKIVTNKNVYLDTYVRVCLRGKKAWNGYVYVDNLTLYAKKTQKMTFNKKDYKDLIAYAFTKRKVTAKVTKIA